MSKTPWTPGPWEAESANTSDGADFRWFVVTPNDTTVAAAFRFPGGEDKTGGANARLIAAAPEMADFLLVAREYIEHTANGEMDKGVSGIAKRDLARLDEILSAIRGDQ